MAQRYDVRGYPTLKFFINGIPINYEKERKTDAMLEFLKKKMEPSIQELKTVEEIKDKAELKGRRCILVSDNSNDLANYEVTGKLVEEFKFYYVTENLGKEYFPEITSPSIVVLRDFGEKKIIYTGSFNPSEIEKYLRTLQFDIVSALDEESAKIVFGGGKKKGILLITYDTVSDEIFENFKEFAEKHKSDKYMYLISKNNNDMGKRYTEFFKISENETPLVEIVDGQGRLSRYRHTGKLNLEELEDFLDDYELGKIEKFIKSEPIPEINPGPVYKVVAKTFNEEIINNDLDIFVKYYAPWCGHCKNLAPIFEQMAANLMENKKLKLVEIDATANDIEGVNINSYPTLYLYPANKKRSPIKYEGGRTEDEMIKFISENAVNKLKNLEIGRAHV